MTEELKKIANLFMLSLVLWREARGEEEKTQIGVAYSILNRVSRPSWWGYDILSVVSKKWQYSSMTDPHDRQLTTWPRSSDPSWWKCMEIADKILKGEYINPVVGADSYYDISIPSPKWATPECFVAQLGRIRFYNLDKDIESEVVNAANNR